SGYSATWKCPKCKESWVARVQTRTNGSGCPFCSGRAVNETNSIKAVHDLAAREFDLRNNDGARPAEIAATHKKTRYNFRCLKTPEHGSYRRSPYARTILNKGCPICFAEEMKALNAPASLAVREPALAMQWLHEKNPFSALEVTPQSNRRAYFICEKGHEQYLRICDKVRRPNCSVCISEVAREMMAARIKPSWKTRPV
ncbi:MAG: zinc-ribbon domain-containing protein, partial [Terriglobales bacterium]